MKTTIPALMLATALASIQPADACHRFHTWRYPWPQKCGVREHRTPDASSRIWYVEVTRAPPTPLEDDARTPEQIGDFDQHYIELDRHRIEINNKMVILHAEEDAARAAGIGQ